MTIKSKVRDELINVGFTFIGTMNRHLFDIYDLYFVNLNYYNNDSKFKEGIDHLLLLSDYKLYNNLYAPELDGGSIEYVKNGHHWNQVAQGNVCHNLMLLFCSPELINYELDQPEKKS